MITVSILSTTEAIKHVLSVMATTLKDSFEIKFFTSTTEMESFIRENYCEIALIDFTAKDLKGEDFYNSLKSDSFYDFLNVLVVVSDEGERMALEMEPYPNLLLCITEKDFLRNCTRTFKILSQNTQFLFNKLLQTKLKINGIGTFVCDNDASDIIIYAALLVTYLTNTERVDMEGKFLLQTSLMEMLLNALEHGNCNITYNEKTHWLESGHDILELIAERNLSPEINSKKIIIEYNAYEKQTDFCIKDEGEGFDWRSILEKDIEPNLHGMGIKMTERMVKHLSYNEKGNEVYFSIENSPMSPKITVKNLKIKTFKKDEQIFVDNEKSKKISFLINGCINCLLSDKTKIRYCTIKFAIWSRKKPLKIRQCW